MEKVVTATIQLLMGGVARYIETDDDTYIRFKSLFGTSEPLGMKMKLKMVQTEVYKENKVKSSKVMRLS